MEKDIGYITEETWPEARAILDAYSVAYRTESSEGWRNVWVDAEDFAGEPWCEGLIQAQREGRIVWQAISRPVEGIDHCRDSPDP